MTDNELWIRLPKGSWDIWWVIFGKYTANPFYVTYEWQATTGVKP